jgi:hypothetical protein
MRCHISTNKSLSVLLAVLLLTVTLSIGSAGTAWAGSRTGNTAAIDTGDGERPLHHGYPVQFSGVGTIDRITNKIAVIDDSFFEFDERASFNTPRSRHTSSSRFQPGDVVGYLINSDGQIESLWMIQEARP